MAELARALLVSLLIAMTFSPLLAAESELQDRLRLQQRYDRLFEQMLLDAKNLDLMFEFAQVAGRLGNFESAVSTLERMLILNPNLPRVRLELGVLYYRLGSYEIARTYLTDALQSDGLPPAVEKRINIYLADTERELSPHKFSGTVFFGTRWQSNANAAPSSDIVRARGRDAVLDRTFTEDDDFDAFFSGSIRHIYDFQNQRGDHWDSELIGYAARQFDVTDLNLMVFELRSGPRFSILNRSSEIAARLRPYAVVNLVRLDDQKLFHTLGGGLEAFTNLSTKIAIEGRYEIRHEEFSNTVDRPNAATLTSNEHEFTVNAAYTYSPKTRLGTRATFVYDNAAERYNDNWELGLSAWVEHEYGAPFAVTPWPWTVFFELEWIRARYDAPDPSVDPFTTRSDDEWRLTLSNTARFSKNWAFETQLHYTDVNSNLPNFEFDNTALTVGLSARF